MFILKSLKKITFLKERKYFIILSVLSILSFLVSITTGSSHIKIIDVFYSLFTPQLVDSTDLYIIRFLRIPRACSAFLCGGILSLSGLCFQTVFKNPLADSYVLGISSGASFSVSLGLLFGLNTSSVYSLPIISFLGSISTSLLLFYLGKKSVQSMLLSGVALNFFLSACTSLFIFIGKRQVQLVLYWTMGSLSSSTYYKIIIFTIISLLLIIFLLYKNKDMDLLLLNETASYSLGINVRICRLIILVTASLCTSIVVAYCGVIGFIGLMCPHIMRKILGPKHKALILCSFMLGSFILQISDIISKILIKNSELPIGIITSVIGAPVFFFIISKRKSGYS